MGLIAKETGNGGGIAPIAPGMYQAVCVGVYDMGSTMSERWKKLQHKVYIEWEIQEERVEIDGKSLPRSIRKKYTLSLGEMANLRGDLEAWRGRPFTADELAGFDLKHLLGVNCYLNMIHNASQDGRKVYANIASIAPLRKADQRITPEAGTRFFSFEGGSLPGDEVPEWLRKQMAESEEYRALSGARSVSSSTPYDGPGDDDAPGGNDDIPF